MQFYSNSRSNQASTLENVFLTLYVLRNRWFDNSFKTGKKHFQMSTDNKEKTRTVISVSTLLYSSGASCTHTVLYEVISYQ